MQAIEDKPINPIKLGKVIKPFIISASGQTISILIIEPKNTQKQNNYKQKDGVILDDSKVEKKPQTNNKVGEYVDFEEIE